MSLELVVRLDPVSGATHAVRWDSRGPADDLFVPGVSSATSARVALGADDAEPDGWTLRSAVASPVADRMPLDRPFVLSLYVPRDLDAILDFDRRITQRYTEFWGSVGEHYAGTVRSDARTPGWLGEIHWYDASTVAEAESMLDDVVIPDDVVAIVDECRDLQDRERGRHNLWFEPLAP